MELEYAASTGYKVITLETKQPQVSAAIKQAATEFVKPSGSLNTTVARTTSRADKLMDKGSAQVLHTPKQSAIHQRTSDTKSNTSNNWTVVNQSPSNKHSPVLQKQNLQSKVIGFSNSFDVLLNEGEHDLKEAGNKEQ